MKHFMPFSLVKLDEENPVNQALAEQAQSVPG